MVLNAVKFVLVVMGAGYLLIMVAMWIFQSRLVYVPSRTQAGTPSDVFLPYEEVWLESTGGNRVHAWYVPAAEGTEPVASVVFCHGNGGNITHRLDTLAILHRIGAETVIFDYQGYGQSQGSPSEQGTFDDAAAAYDWLVAERGGDPARMVAMGRSLGGCVASWLAENRKVAGLVLESTFTSVPDMGARLYPWLPVRTLSRFQYDTLARLGRLDCPVLVAHSPEDDIVPYALGVELYESYQGPKSFLGLSGGHNEGFLLTGAVYDEGLARFFADVTAER